MRLSVGITGLLVLLAGCGSGGGTTSGPGGNQGSGSLVAVGVQDYSFSPGSISITVGTAVKWSNNGPSEHTVTSDAGSWNSAVLTAPSGGGYYGGTTAGGSFQRTFGTAGTYSYHCSYHPQMTGTITVTP